MPIPIAERTVRVTDFDSVSIKLASPENIRDWSFGEVTKSETINYRTQRPEKDGLFDERIFGPERDFECYCGKYKRVRFKGVVCDKCGVEVTKSSVRRERMGHIELAVPVAHIWFLRGVPSRIGMLLNLPLDALERVIYFNGYIITNINEEAKKSVLSLIEREWKQKNSQIKDKASKAKLKTSRDRALEEVKRITRFRTLSEPEYFELSMRYAEIFSAGTGAETIKGLLEKIDLEQLEKKLETELEKSTKLQQRKISRRLQLVRSLLSSGIKPENMIFSVLPVLPPDLRPMVQLDGGRFATSDLNDLYRRVINRNNRLKHLQELSAPEVIQRNEKRMLQESVDALIDNYMRKTSASPVMGAARRPLRSLADMLKGKQGRFRQNLLGKRVDYSGRSVIVVGPDLKLRECGLPKEMAMELFKPFVVQRLLEREYAFNIKKALHIIEEKEDIAWAILEEVIADKYVLLNRAPTLHRLSVQAFSPRLIEGKAIQIHPLTCPAFNADFDGDQMAVHVPISLAAQKEAKDIMLSSRNLFKPASGLPVAVPRHEIVLGIYMMTSILEEYGEQFRTLSSSQEAKLLYDLGYIELSTPIKLKIDKSVANDAMRLEDCKIHESAVITTVGRIIFNEVLPLDFPFINAQLKSRHLEHLTSELISRQGVSQAALIIDAIKDLGFEYSTKTAVTFGMTDLVIPKEKKEIVSEAMSRMRSFRSFYEEGLLTNDERRKKTVDLWLATKSKIDQLVPKTIHQTSSVFSMVDSGSRGSWTPVAQMAGMKGPVVNPSFQIMEVPVISSFAEGFNVLEYFISNHGARKGTTDTALRTATAGHLTRRLVDVAQEVLVREDDCGAKGTGIKIYRKDTEDTGQEFYTRLIGRVAVDNIKTGRKLIVRGGEAISVAQARLIDSSGIEEILVRSPLTCKTRRGVCRQCYGWDLGRDQLIAMGEAVGIIAAQAIGEPGTQLTMRTFHTGGIASVSDITQGLLRVEEIFEARPPKGRAVISEISGKIVSIKNTTEGKVVNIEPALYPSKQKTKTKKENEEIVVPHNLELIVSLNDKVEKGQPLTRGSIDLKELFKAAGLIDTQRYMLKELHRIYDAAGAVVNDKHIEIIIKQMFSRVRVKDPGETTLTIGSIMPQAKFLDIKDAAQNDKKKLPKASHVLLGITATSLSSESFLSAASFQETSRVLIEAGVSASKDNLYGLKENLIIGRLIPAGTGFRKEYAGDAYIGTLSEEPQEQGLKQAETFVSSAE